jgi:hypothetical protein
MPQSHVQIDLFIGDAMPTTAVAIAGGASHSLAVPPGRIKMLEKSTDPRVKKFYHGDFDFELLSIHPGVRRNSSFFGF